MAHRCKVDEDGHLIGPQGGQLGDSDCFVATGILGMITSSFHIHLAHISCCNAREFPPQGRPNSDVSPDSIAEARLVTLNRLLEPCEKLYQRLIRTTAGETLTLVTTSVTAVVTISSTNMKSTWLVVTTVNPRETERSATFRCWDPLSAHLVDQGYFHSHEQNLYASQLLTSAARSRTQRQCFPTPLTVTINTAIQRKNLPSKFFSSWIA